MSQGSPDPSRITEIAEKAALLGKTAAVPVIQSVLREQVVYLFQQYDPEKLRELIDVNYPLIRHELPDGYKNAIENVAPQFEDEIKSMTHPGQVLYWLEEPAEWMGSDADPETVRQVRECYEIIESTPGGERWVEQQVAELWAIAGFV